MILNDRVLYKKSVGISVIKKMYKLFSDLNICFHTLEYGAYVGDYREKHYCVPLNDFSTFVEVHRNNVYKISIICDDKSQVRRVLKAFDDYDINANTRIVKKNGKIFVEVLSKINDKLIGVKKIAKMNKISMDEILAIVASDTDVNVAKEVGRCVVVRNGCEKIRNVVKEMTSSNDEKGVEAVLKKYL